jgi:hypothetical protein
MSDPTFVAGTGGTGQMVTTVTVPSAGVSPGMFAVAKYAVCAGSTDGTTGAAITLPSGWTLLAGSKLVDSTTTTGIIATKTLVAADIGAAMTVNHNNGSGTKAEIEVTVWGSCADVHVVSAAKDTGGGTAHTTPTATTTIAGCRVLALASQRDNVPNTSWSSPANWTNRASGFIVPTPAAGTLVATGVTASHSSGVDPIGSVGGVVLTAAAASTHVLLWTVALTPGATPGALTKIWHWDADGTKRPLKLTGP